MSDVQHLFFRLVYNKKSINGGNGRAAAGRNGSCRALQERMGSRDEGDGGNGGRGGAGSWVKLVLSELREGLL